MQCGQISLKIKKSLSNLNYEISEFRRIKKEKEIIDKKNKIKFSKFKILI